jgi:hypothetical protein
MQIYIIIIRSQSKEPLPNTNLSKLMNKFQSKDNILTIKLLNT